MALPKPFPNNPRKITAERLAALGESLIEFGDLSAIIINVGKGRYKNCIVSANQRSKHIPLDDITWTVKHDTPTPAGTVREGYVLHGGERFAVREVSWDDKKCEVANLRANNYGGQNDASLLKFFDDDVLVLGGVNMVFESQPLVFAPQDERDQLPEMENAEQSRVVYEAKEDEDFEPTEIKTLIKLGDVFEIKQGGVIHRIVCGDSTLESTFDIAMRGDVADLVFTDPDFALESEDVLKCYENCNTHSRGAQFWITSDRQAVILASKYIESFSHFFVHDFKVPLLVSNSRPMQRHSIILKFGAKKMKNIRDGFSSIIQVATTRVQGYHKGTRMAKRIALPFVFLAHYMEKGEIVLDCFAHSGSTMMAAQQLGVNSVNIEIEPIYCQFMIDRFFSMYQDSSIEKIN